jgi:hypothetical protein
MANSDPDPMDYGIRLLLDGVEYVFAADQELAAREAVQLNLLLMEMRLAPFTGRWPNVATMNLWAKGYLFHNNLWRHFKRLSPETMQDKARAFWKQ